MENKELKVSVVGNKEQFPEALRYAATQISEGYLSGDLRTNGIEFGSWDISATETDGEWIIWSIEHQAWWAPNENGYIHKRDEAGKYSYKDALRIVRSANISNFNVPNEAMIKIN